MHRFYAPPPRFDGQMVTLDPDESHHLARVLRLKTGDKVEVCDGRGANFAAEVVELHPRGAVLKILAPLPVWGESPLPVTLGIALAKGEALDVVLRQATEMGVTRIIPFLSERSEQPSGGRLSRRAQRWPRLTQESLKSCQRSILPDIALPLDLATALAGPEEAKLIFWEEERGGGLTTLLHRPRPENGVRLLIGPEGGFAAREVDLARAHGYQVVSLGPRRLKVATAALAAVALIQFAWGDLA